MLPTTPQRRRRHLGRSCRVGGALATDKILWPVLARAEQLGKHRALWFSLVPCDGITGWCWRSPCGWTLTV
eukprot:3841394-Pyramimonas_sp.AAC.1